jgi:hypothetical protein
MKIRLSSEELVTLPKTVVPANEIGKYSNLQPVRM